VRFSFIPPLSIIHDVPISVKCFVEVAMFRVGDKVLARDHTFAWYMDHEDIGIYPSMDDTWKLMPSTLARDVFYVLQDR